MIYKLAFALYVLFLLTLSACKSAELFLPQIYALEDWLGGDKLMHLKLAMLLSIFALTALTPRMTRKHVVHITAIMVLLSFGLVIDELHQLMLGSRRFEWVDTAYGLSGLLLGLIFRLLMDYSFLVLKSRFSIYTAKK